MGVRVSVPHALPSLPPLPASASPRPVILWGVNRHTVLAALVFQKKRGSTLRIVTHGSPAAVVLPDVRTIVAEDIPTEALVLVSGTAPGAPQISQASQFDLDHGSEDALTAELKRLSIVDLHGVQRRLLSLGLEPEAAFIHNFIFYRFNCRIPATAEIGEGTTFAYGGIGVVVHKDSTIGRDVKVGQNVTLGARANGAGPPKIGDGVFIGPNSVCLGGSVGAGAVIGAGSVVLHPVAADEVVAGNPARPVRRRVGGEERVS